MEKEKTLSQLNILDVGGSRWDVWGTLDAIRPQYDEIVEAMNSCNGTAPKTVSVRGFDSTPSRWPLVLTMLTEHIRGVYLLE